MFASFMRFILVNTINKGLILLKYYGSGIDPGRLLIISVTMSYQIENRYLPSMPFWDSVHGRCFFPIAIICLLPFIFCYWLFVGWSTFFIFISCLSTVIWGTKNLLQPVYFHSDGSLYLWLILWFYFIIL